MRSYIEFSELAGKTLTKIDGLEAGSEDVTFECNDGSLYELSHVPDCCESVSVEDVAGDVSDLLNSRVELAEVITSNDNPPGVTKEYRDSFTWSFYKIRTNKGSVTIRWYGESNGYYGETASFGCLREPGE
jgi:hypothetical protein